MLGVGFFSSDKFRLFTKPFLTEFFNNHLKGIVVIGLNLERFFIHASIFRRVMVFKDCSFGQFGRLTRDIFRYINA